jgi:hypothetical protein
VVSSIDGINKPLFTQALRIMRCDIGITTTNCVMTASATVTFCDALTMIPLVRRLCAEGQFQAEAGRVFAGHANQISAGVYLKSGFAGC